MAEGATTRCATAWQGGLTLTLALTLTLTSTLTLTLTLTHTNRLAVLRRGKVGRRRSAEPPASTLEPLALSQRVLTSLRTAQVVLVVGHANCLRALIKNVQGLSDEEVRLLGAGAGAGAGARPGTGAGAGGWVRGWGWGWGRGWGRG